MMTTYAVTKQVTLIIEAKDRKEAAKYASEWQGESSIFSTDGLNVKWNLRSKRTGINRTV